MKKVIKKISVITSVLTAVSAATFAQDVEKINVVTSAVPFLRISPDARAGAMGETGLVTSPDANAQFYNVAKYPFAANESGVGLTYTPWLKKLGLNDVYLASAAGYYKLDESQAISASLRYFSLGNLQLTDASGNDLSSERPREMGVDVGYSRKLSDRLALGIALRYINSNLVGRASVDNTNYKAGNAAAGDLGLYYTTVTDEAGGLSLGAALSNLGTKISYTSDATQKNFLPANLGLGGGYTWVTNEVHRLSLNGEINKLLVPAPPSNATEEEYREYAEKGVVDGWLSSFGNKAMAYSAGGEYVYDNQFAVRAGFYSDSRAMGKRNYFTTGFGIKYSFLDINFSYLIASGRNVNTNPLANTLRFSVIISPGVK